MAERHANLTSRSCARSHIGLVRKLNEDAYLDRGDIGLWAVADGMGGHDAGDFASQRVIEGLVRLEANGDLGDLLKAARREVQAAHRDLRAEAAARGGATIGTTLVALLAAQGHFACLWAGDSRLYRFRAGALEQISRDHSLVQDLLAAGQITAEEARVHPQGNIITRAIGALEEPDLERVSGEILAGDLFLLCSDGLTGPVPDDAIHEILAEAANRPGDLGPVLDRLIENALAGGGRDNVTSILVSFSDESAERESGPAEGDDDTLPPGENPQRDGPGPDASALASATPTSGSGPQELIGDDFLADDSPEIRPSDDAGLAGDPPGADSPAQEASIDDLIGDDPIGEEPSQTLAPPGKGSGEPPPESGADDHLMDELMGPDERPDPPADPLPSPHSGPAASDDDLPGGGEDASASIEKLLAEAERAPKGSRGKSPSDKREGGGILGKFRLGRGKRKE
jgi:serine/threonine protein phosphatase PrpC